METNNYAVAGYSARPMTSDEQHAHAEQSWKQLENPDEELEQIPKELLEEHIKNTSLSITYGDNITKDVITDCCGYPVIEQHPQQQLELYGYWLMIGNNKHLARGTRCVLHGAFKNISTPNAVTVMYHTKAEIVDTRGCEILVKRA